MTDKAFKRTPRWVNFISGGASTCIRVIQEEMPGGSLLGASETVAIVANSHSVDGIANITKETKFSEEKIIVVEPGPNFASRILEVLDRYRADRFHQLGWMPQMPEEVLKRYIGCNQHLGPGGKWMYGVRRVYAHMRFCQEVGRIIPIEVFCQLVHPKYDAGKIVCHQIVDLDFRNTPEQNAKILLPIEHEVQINGRQAMFYGIRPDEMEDPINIAQNAEEEDLLFALKKEARDKYPPEK